MTKVDFAPWESDADANRIRYTFPVCAQFTVGTVKAAEGGRPLPIHGYRKATSFGTVK